MKIGIISDSHEQVENIKKAVEFFNKEKVDCVYHCGDIISPSVLHLFAKLNCKIKAVFGNNDKDVFKHLNFKPDNMSFHDQFLSEEINGKKLCMLHGDPVAVVEAIFESKKYDIVLRGHTHVAEIKRNEKTIMINPGNLFGAYSDFTKKYTNPSVAVYDFEINEAIIIEL